MKKKVFGLLVMFYSLVCFGQSDSMYKEMSIKLSCLDFYQFPSWMEFSLDKRISSKLILQQGIGVPVSDFNKYDNSYINYKKLNFKTSSYFKFIITEKEKSYYYCGINLFYKLYNIRKSDSVSLEWKQDSTNYWVCSNRIFDTWNSQRNEFGLRFVFGNQHFYGKNKRLVLDMYFGAGIKTINNKTGYRGRQSPYYKEDDSFIYFLGKLFVPSYGYDKNINVTVFSPLFGFQIGYRIR